MATFSKNSAKFLLNHLQQQNLFLGFTLKSNYSVYCLLHGITPRRQFLDSRCANMKCERKNGQKEKVNEQIVSRYRDSKEVGHEKLVAKRQ